VALIATYDIPYGIYNYLVSMRNWPEYTINRTINTVNRHSEITPFSSTDNGFDINQFLKRATEIYKSERNAYSEDILKELKIDWQPPNDKGFKQYTYIYYRKKHGICQMESQEIYDLETGELLGKSREMMLRNIILLPYFNSLLGGISFGYFAEIVHNRGLSYDVFPRLSEDVVKPLS
jgi:hypothetical protein